MYSCVAPGDSIGLAARSGESTAAWASGSESGREIGVSSSSEHGGYIAMSDGVDKRDAKSSATSAAARLLVASSSAFWGYVSRSSVVAIRSDEAELGEEGEKIRHP